MFPAVVPDTPTMFLIWDEDVPRDLRPSLEAICRLVTYLGHSSSPVRVWIEDRPPPASLIPNNDQATCRLRSFEKGRLDYLVSRYEAGLRPQPTAWQGYAPPLGSNEEKTLQGPYDPALIVLRQTSGRTFALESVGMIANAIRNTLMARCKVAPPEWLSGHAADGSPSRTHRLAYIPLGNVGHAHADGHLLGIALALPRDVPTAAIEALYRQLRNHGEPSERVGEETGYLRLWFRDAGSKTVAGELHLELDERRIGQRPTTLHPNRWTRAACRWTSITQFPRRQVTAEAVVRKTCFDAGFPEPVSVRAGRAPFVSGVPHATSFKVEMKPGNPVRLLMHAEVEFSRPVSGPMVLGAGRFRGFGVMLPRDGEVR
jgi:CRISPR-associated protein Csb2